MHLLTNQRTKILQFAIIPSLLILGLYVWFYEYSPLSDFTNLLALNLLTVFCAAFCGVILTLITSRFQSDEPARAIWLSFALGLWLWVSGELLWSYYSLRYTDVPLLSSADIFWAIGYVFLFFSISRQYQLIFPHLIKKIRWTTLAIGALSLMATTLLVLIFDSANFWTSFLATFYVVGDLVIAIAALVLVFIFRSGWLARPWLSLFAFVVADALYLWATSSGIYDFGMNQDTISLIVDTAYLLAYIILGWGVLNQYLLLRIETNTPLTSDIN